MRIGSRDYRGREVPRVILSKHPRPKVRAGVRGREGAGAPFLCLRLIRCPLPQRARFARSTCPARDPRRPTRAASTVRTHQHVSSRGWRSPRASGGDKEKCLRLFLIKTRSACMRENDAPGPRQGAAGALTGTRHGPARRARPTRHPRAGRGKRPGAPTPQIAPASGSRDGAHDPACGPFPNAPCAARSPRP